MISRERQSVVQDSARIDREDLRKQSRMRFMQIKSMIEKDELKEEESQEAFGENGEEELINRIEKMDIEPFSSGAKKNKRATRKNKTYAVVKESLQLSSYLLRTDPKENFEEEYMLVPKPIGRRVLIISASNTTQILHQDGSSEKFSTYLPGGHKGSYSKLGSILDGILSEDLTLYIIDAMFYDGNSYLDTPAEIRHYFLQNNIGEKLAKKNGTNHLSIKLAPHLALDRASCDLVKQVSFESGADGLLLIQKHSDYLMGELNPESYWLRKRGEQGVLGRLLLSFNEAERAFESSDGLFSVKVPERRVEVSAGSMMFPKMVYWVGEGDSPKVRLMHKKTYVLAFRCLPEDIGLVFPNLEEAYTVEENTYKAPYDAVRVKKKLRVMKDQVYMDELYTIVQ